MSSSASNKHVHSQIQPSLRLTVKSEQKQFTDNTSEEKEQKSVPTKEINLNKLNFKPNNTEFYLGVIRVLQADDFRISLSDKDQHWISKTERFDKHKTESMQIDQYRNDLIHALENPSKGYEFHHSDFVMKDTHKKGKQIVIYRKINATKYKLAKFRLFPGKKNLFYILEKAEETLKSKRRDRGKYEQTNKTFKDKCDKQMSEMDSIIAEKNALEKTLVNKFMRVLNEKKKRIRELQNEILALKGETNANHDLSVSDEEINEVNYDNIVFDSSMAMMDNINESDIDMQMMDRNERNKNKNVNDGLLYDLSLNDDEEQSIIGKKRSRNEFNESMAVVEIVNLCENMNKNKKRKVSESSNADKVRRKSDASDSSFDFNSSAIV